MSAPHKYTLKWPEGASFQMDEKSINEIRNSLEMQFKHLIYSQPGFRFFQSIGNTNFFQASLSPFPTWLTGFKVCCLNLEALKELLHILTSASAPSKLLPTTRLPETADENPSDPVKLLLA